MKNSLKNKNVLVYGLGKSGLASFELLKTVKANVITFDDNRFINANSTIDYSKLDFAVVSPGISPNSEIYQKLLINNVKIISEIELAHIFLNGKKIAITGTNGKTTTVTLLGYIFKKYFNFFKRKNVFTAGNIGIPLASIALKTNKKSITFIEVSSFQLEKIQNFNADYVSILNIAPDHLDRYKNIEEYIEAKEKIFDNQNENQIAILNYNDAYHDRFLKKCKGIVYSFSMNDESKNTKFKGIFKHDDRLFFKNLNNEYLLSIKNVKLLGNKNLENILVAVLIAKLEGLNMQKVENIINSFSPLEHRLEIIKIEDNITYINDSKATNIASAVADINAVEGNKIVLLGGSDKGEDFSNLALSLKGDKSIKKYFIYGATKKKIEEALKNNKINNYITCEKFEEAVKKAQNFARNQNNKINVLLAPACASFDEFENYIERGKTFKKIILLNKD